MSDLNNKIYSKNKSGIKVGNRSIVGNKTMIGGSKYIFSEEKISVEESFSRFISDKENYESFKRLADK